jgi:hypothetical protein
MDGTQSAVNRPSSFCPENHRYPDSANEIATARRIKTSDCLIIFAALILAIVGTNGGKQTTHYGDAADAAKARVPSDRHHVCRQQVTQDTNQQDHCHPEH